METTDITSLIEARAKQLAYEVLTRRDDLVVTRNERLDGIGVDLAVTILRDGEETGQLFGVKVKGVRSHAGLRKTTKRDPSLIGVPLPFVSFVFNMENDEGHWRWLVEPLTGPNTPPGAVRVTEMRLEPLTDEAVAGIVDKVHQWWEARIAHLRPEHAPIAVPATTIAGPTTTPT